MNVVFEEYSRTKISIKIILIITPSLFNWQVISKFDVICLKNKKDCSVDDNVVFNKNRTLQNHHSMIESKRKNVF